MKYVCLRCGFKASQRSNLESHLNRKNVCEPIDDFISINEVKKHYGFEINMPSLKNDSKKLQNDSIWLQNDSIWLQNENNNGSKKLHLAPKCQNFGSKKLHLAPFSGEPEVCSENQCKYCLKFYSKTSNLNKHLKNCKKKKEIESACADENEELKKEIKEMKEEHNKEILELKETVKILINNSDSLSGNTTNNNNSHNNIHSNNTDNSTHNTININNYGSENKDYITKEYLIKLLKEPFQAIPRLIEYTHFNKDHPENQNIKLPNKKQPYVKVLKDDKWVYADRKSTILDLIDEKHSELNDGPLIKHVEDKFSEHLQDRFERFNDRYLNDEKDFTTQLYKETELVMINNR